MLAAPGGMSPPADVELPICSDETKTFGARVIYEGYTRVRGDEGYRSRRLLGLDEREYTASGMRSGRSLSGAGRRRRPRCVAVLVLCLMVALFPALAASKTSHHSHHHHASHFPSCSHISRPALANLAQTGQLTLRKRTGNLCEFTGKHPGHYEPRFEIELVPYSQQLWNTIKSDAQSSAAANGDQFGQASPKEVFVVGRSTDSGLDPCKKEDGKPGKGESKFAPACAPEPDAVSISVYGHGTDKRLHMDIIVSSAVTGQAGDVHLSHMLQLVKDVVSGKIH